MNPSEPEDGSMLKELISSAVSSAKDRLSSPIFGAFAIAWCLSNSPMLFIVFFGTGVDERMSQVNRYVLYSWWAPWVNGLVYPSIAVLAYIFVYPYAKRYVYTFMQKQDNELHAERIKIENSRVMTRDEAVRLRQAMREKDRRHGEVVADMAQTIADLQNQLNERANTEVDLGPEDIGDPTILADIFYVLLKGATLSDQ